MRLVALVEDDAIPSEDIEMVESGRAQYGQLLSTWRAILNRPGLFATYLPFLRAVAAPGAVDTQIKDLSALLVAHLNHCRYTVSHRYASALRNGVTEELAARVVSGDWAETSEQLQLALELATRLTEDPPVVDYATEPQVVPHVLLERMRALYRDEEVVELVMSISVWNALSRFHRVMGFELDMPAPPDELVPQ